MIKMLIVPSLLILFNSLLFYQQYKEYKRKTNFKKVWENLTRERRI